MKIFLFHKLLIAALCFLWGALFAVNATSRVAPADLQCEYRTNPLGVDIQTPRFAWVLSDPDAARGQKQTAYHLLVASDSTLLAQEQGDVWNSGKIHSSQSVLIPFQGNELRSNRKYYWKVKVYDKDGKPSAWSETACFTTGLLHSGDWAGSWWMRHPYASNRQHVWFRKKVTLDAPAESALIHLASLGYHELYVNGQRVDDRVLAPALTRLSKRVMYVTYDVSSFLRTGDNVIAVWQGPGWANFRFFSLPSGIQVLLCGEDRQGNPLSLYSESWRENGWRCEISNSENTSLSDHGNHGGEEVDARRWVPDWNQVDFDDSNWSGVWPVDMQPELCAHSIDPTRVIETIRPVAITGEGPFRVDMGKNFTGWVNLEMSGLDSGDTVTIQVSDDEDTVQDCGQLSRYICNGAGKETFCNRFNYFCGRYITISGLKRKPNPSEVTAYALGTDLERTGHFTSSNDLFNKIYETDLWTFRVNTTEGYTADCPHREREGYGEVAFATAWGIGLPNYRAGAFYHKIIRDWTDVQEADGWIHHTAPQISDDWGGTMWSSAGLNIAWEHYVHFGDCRTLELIYLSAKRWLEFLHLHTQDGLLTPYREHWGRFLGDWAAPKQRNDRGDTPQALFFNNCVYAMNLTAVVRMAKVLGHGEDAATYEARLEALKPVIHRTFFRPETNTYLDGIQVQQAFPLLTGVTPAHLRTAVAGRFEEAIDKHQPYLDMGSSGLPVLMQYLTEHTGCGQMVARHLAKTTEPGYGYFLRRGETTWPEHWNVDVQSRIHTCYTGIASWFVKGLCGIRPDAARPGYQSFLIRPVVVSEATYAEASVESPYGRIDSRWERKGRKVELSVTIPPNSTATVYIPARRSEGITESGVDIRKAEGVTWVGMDGDYAVVTVSSGKYTFASTFDIRKTK